MKKDKIHAINKRMFSVASAALFILFSSSTWAAVVDSNLTFSSQNQSMWGTGAAIQLDQTDFYGTTWNESGSVGGFIGGNTRVLNPLWSLWSICPAFCPPEPTKYFNVDTTTGLQVSANTQGRIGFELGVRVDSGSVDAAVNYNTQVIVPETRDINAGEYISLNPTSSLTGNSLASQFPTMSASLSVVMEVSATFAATGCALGNCASTSFGTGTLGGTQELIAFNQDSQGGIEYFGGSGFLSDALDVAVAVGAVSLPTGFPAELEIPAPGLGNLGTITAHLPQPNTSGGLDATGTKLTSQGQDDLLDLSIDVDNLLSIALTGVGGLFGGSQDIGGGFGLSYDLINVELGPQIDLVQSFEFTPTLMVDLEFSQPVDVTGYGQVTSLSELNWDDLPTMAFGNGTTGILPTFYLGYMVDNMFTENVGELFSQLFLDIDGNIRVDLLTATFSSVFGDETIGLGNLINESFDLFTTPALYSNRFAMAGFAPITGAAFDVRVPVPEPGFILLYGTGFFLFGLIRHRRIKM